MPTCASINLAAGLSAAFQIFRAQRNLVLLPIVTVVVGALYQCALCCCFAFFMTQIYLSIPYALDSDVANLLGFVEGIFIAYLHMGRDYATFDPRKAENWMY